MFIMSICLFLQHVTKESKEYPGDTRSRTHETFLRRTMIGLFNVNFALFMPFVCELTYRAQTNKTPSTTGQDEERLLPKFKFGPFNDKPQANSREMIVQGLMYINSNWCVRSDQLETNR
jgi:hypothetical protein